MSDDPIQRLIGELGRLPGIGERSAARLAFHILKASTGPASVGRDLAAALLDATARTRLCAQCQNLCAAERCNICGDPRREPGTLCVVEGVADLRAVEASGSYRGRYFVLHGALAPLDGIGPQDLNFAGLVQQVRAQGCREVILATNPDVEGDATALYLAQLLVPLGVQVSRLATGIPMGGELEYMDQATLGRALQERRAFGA